MARSAHNDVLDDGLDAMKTAVDSATGSQIVCSSEPATYAAALAAALATQTNPDLTIADDTSGRKATVSAATAVSITASGNATHIALVESVGTKLWFVTTCTPQDLVSGGTVDIPAWKVN